MTLYWTRWLSAHPCWGFPWTWNPGLHVVSGHNVCCALIVASSHSQVIELIEWFAPASQVLSAEIRPSGWRPPQTQFPTKSWWPEPEKAWSGKHEQGYKPSFWGEKR